LHVWLMADARLQGPVPSAKADIGHKRAPFDLRDPQSAKQHMDAGLRCGPSWPPNAPLTCGLLAPFSPDKKLATEKRSQLDHHYACVTHDLDELLRAVGLKVAA